LRDRASSAVYPWCARYALLESRRHGARGCPGARSRLPMVALSINSAG
jgi:hypothetical protein